MPDFLTILRAWRLLELHLDNFNAFFPQALGELWRGPLVRDQPANSIKWPDLGDASAP
jgi:hypothetical protein